MEETASLPENWAKRIEGLRSGDFHKRANCKQGSKEARQRWIF
jgi:hypothetical protein